jgi:hypothetical protein
MMNMISHDYSDVERLDQHFANQRTQALALEAEAQRTQHAARMATLRNERIRTTGIAALLGGVGVGLALFGASFLIVPKERVVFRDVPGPERYVYRDPPVPAPLPHRPVAETPLAPPYAPRTPEEKPFTEKPEYRDASYHGVIIKSVDGRALSFADGKSFWPCHWNGTECPKDETLANDSDPYVGDLGMCTPDKEHPVFSHCVAFHNGQETNIRQKPAEHAEGDSPTRAAENMINVDVDAAGYQIKAVVDTGCSFPMAVISARPSPVEPRLFWRMGARQKLT